MPYKPPKIHVDPPQYHLTKDIKNYVIYGDGRIWTKKRQRFLKGSFNPQTGYIYATLNGKRQAVHRIIGETFIPNPDNLPQLDHWDNNKLNNNVSNLSWVTNEQNYNKAYNDGLIQKGEDCHTSVLTEIQAKAIKYGHKDLSQPQIAKLYGIDQPAVSRIKNGKRWSHI